MTVCDDMRRIRHINCGYTGLAHNSRVITNSFIGRRPSEFLKDEEYLLAESDYASTKYVIASYKKPAALQLAVQDFDY